MVEASVLQAKVDEFQPKANMLALMHERTGASPYRATRGELVKASGLDEAKAAELIQGLLGSHQVELVHMNPNDPAREILLLQASGVRELKALERKITKLNGQIANTPEAKVLRHMHGEPEINMALPYRASRWSAVEAAGGDEAVVRKLEQDGLVEVSNYGALSDGKPVPNHPHDELKLSTRGEVKGVQMKEFAKGSRAVGAAG